MSSYGMFASFGKGSCRLLLAVSWLLEMRNTILNERTRSDTRDLLRFRTLLWRKPTSRARQSLLRILRRTMDRDCPKIYSFYAGNIERLLGGYVCRFLQQEFDPTVKEAAAWAIGYIAQHTAGEIASGQADATGACHTGKKEWSPILIH